MKDSAVASPLPRTWTDPPPVEAAPYGLLSVAAVTTGEGTWQIGGVEYDTDACSQGSFVPGSCPRALPGTDQTATVTATPQAGGAVVAAPGGNDLTVAYALVPNGGAPATGLLAPGESVTVALPDGDYQLQVQVTGQPLVAAADDVTVPGGPARTATATLPAGTGTTHDKPLAEGLVHVTSPGPVTVYARAECNAVGFEDPAGLARRRLGLIEGREVERYFSAYLLGAVGARLPLGGDPVSLNRALGALEADAGLYYGGSPVFHAPRWAQTDFSTNRLLRPNKDTQPMLRTVLDSRIAFGSGYYANPFAPAVPPPAGQFWLMATGQVRAWRGEAFANETFTEATNLRAAIAERTYLLDADCYRAAVLVALDGDA
jgi:hypothetical protein